MSENTELKENTQETENSEVEEETAESAELSTEDKLKKEIEELNDKYLRLMSEYANYQNRTAKEKTARYADAIVDAVAELLPIGDNLERALKTEVKSEDAIKFKEGIEMVMKQFNDSLAKLKVKPIKAEGEQFDPNIHNAVMHIEDETIDENTVVEDLMKGYMYNDERVVRHSMVKVAN